jgi:hypothetical protein
MSYDLIGDIHGQADKLESLLDRLGYRDTGGLWRHPSRKVIFVGDFIDRGPHQLRTVTIARRMVEEGAALAVMGNHELNAIAWATLHPSGNGEYLRPHFHSKWGEKNRKQHVRFLEEVEHLPKLHQGLVDWFMTLPLWLDLPGLRVVHACWQPRFMAWLQPQLTAQRQLRQELLEPATTEPKDKREKDTAEPSVFKAVEAIVKGIEIPLPEPHGFHDKDGFERHRVRVRWWDTQAADYWDAAMLDEASRTTLPRTPIPDHARIAPPTDKPIFFGHYWLTGAPRVLAPHAACLDYSAGKGGALVAYRWDGESHLTDAHFVSVP